MEQLLHYYTCNAFPGYQGGLYRLCTHAGCWWLTLVLLLSCVMAVSLQSTNWAWFRILQMKIAIYCSLLSLYRLAALSVYLNTWQHTEDTVCCWMLNLLAVDLPRRSHPGYGSNQSPRWKPFIKHFISITQALVHYTGHSVSHPSKNQIWIWKQFQNIFLCRLSRLKISKM